MRLYQRVIVVHDVVRAQQHIAQAAGVRVGQGAFFKVSQFAQRGRYHHAASSLQNARRRKHAVANKVRHKSRGRAVVQRIGVVPLVQTASVHHANAVANGKRLKLVMRHKQSCGPCGF